MTEPVAYYNEFDPVAAAVLRELIKARLIANGLVDERSIEDVQPSDLTGFSQHHFFAGFGVWSYALRGAGWPDTKPVWTVSCPCQPFSAAGTGNGFDDERHLWPAQYHLVSQFRPSVIIGEQVASSLTNPWVDLVHADLEALGYTFGGVPFPSAGVGAPHIRDRFYWVAHANSERHDRAGGIGEVRRFEPANRRNIGGMAHTDSGERNRQPVGAIFSNGTARGWQQGYGEPGSCGTTGRVVDSDHAGSQGRALLPQCSASFATGAAGVVSQLGIAPSIGCERIGDQPEHRKPVQTESNSSPGAGPTNGFWRDADWLGCTDGKWRPVEPGTFPLANGAAARVGRLRGYGNAVNAEAAKKWIEVVQSVIC